MRITKKESFNIMLAIIIPYYKLTFFDETLMSLASQTDKRFKVYIGDDASPENPSALLEKYKGQFDFVYHRFAENLGGKSLTQQWERCIALSGQEEWLMILGDDDVLGENVVEAFYINLEEIKKIDVTVVRFASQVIDEKGTTISKLHHHPKIEKATDFLLRKLKGGTRSSLSEYVFKRDLVDKLQFKELPLAWYSDLLAVLEFSKWAHIFTINETVVYFRHSGLNITCRTDDFVVKNEATFQFYHYLLSNCGFRFSKVGVQLLFDRIEKTLLDNKKNAKHWRQIFALYFKFSQFKRILILSLKIKKSIK